MKVDGIKHQHSCGQSQVWAELSREGCDVFGYGVFILVISNINRVSQKLLTVPLNSTIAHRPVV